MSPLESKLEAVRREDPNGYGKRDIPCKLDDLMAALLDELVASDPLERRRVIKDADEMLARVAFVFAERMASLAVRRGSAVDAFRGILALAAFQGSTNDPRDALLILPLLYDAELRLGRDPRADFERTRAYVDARAVEWLERFSTRSERDRSIEAMGYRVGADAGGFRYERTW
jgi:hypothetical protein